MKQIKCDICGGVIQPRESGAHLAERGGDDTGFFGAMVRSRDVCARCMEIGRALDPEAVFVLRWQERVGGIESGRADAV